MTLEGADVVVHAGDETIRLHEPVVYQEGAAGRERVNGRFTVKGRRIGFEVAAYDRTRPLVIDPVVSYATYLGGAGDQTGAGIGVDAAGNIYTAIRTAAEQPGRGARADREAQQRRPDLALRGEPRGHEPARARRRSGR